MRDGIRALSEGNKRFIEALGLSMKALRDIDEGEGGHYEGQICGYCDEIKKIEAVLKK